MNHLNKQHLADRTAACRFERKFFLPPEKVDWARHLLQHVCLADQHYPAGTIHSVYYDSANLACYYASEEGSCHRDKVRIRWYDQAQSMGPEITGYVELKTKEGFAGFKQRQACSIEQARLNKTDMVRGLIGRDQLMKTLAEFGYYPDERPLPTLLVTYRRLRFVDFMTKTRISLDWNIRSLLLSSHCDRQEGYLTMRGGILEIKGPRMEIPVALRGIRMLDTDWTRYSKYGSCLDSQLAALGATGRLWPSGRAN